MHEMSLMEGITRIVSDKAEDMGIKKITKIKLVVGKLTNAFPDALQLAFSVIRKEESIFDSTAELEIEERATIGNCKECSQEFEIKDHYSFICPDCASLNVNIVSGRELYVDYFEGE